MKARSPRFRLLTLALTVAAALGATAQESPGFSVILQPAETAVGDLEPLYLSPWTMEIVKLAQAGIEDGVTLSFVSNSAGIFNLGADQIIYLRDAGVSGVVINGMIEHDRELNSGTWSTTASTVPLPTLASPTHVASGTQGSAEATLLAIHEWNARLGATAAAAPPTSAALSPPLSTPKDGRSDNSEGAVHSEPPDLELITAATAVSCTTPAAIEEMQQSGDDFYRVREPRPVQLTVPIVMLRAFGRHPNIQIIEPLH